MTIDDAEYVRVKIEDEGMHYCFSCYSDFEDIKDDKFHELRKAYLKSADDLSEYINKCLENKEHE